MRAVLIHRRGPWTRGSIGPFDPGRLRGKRPLRFAFRPPADRQSPVRSPVMLTWIRSRGRRMRQRAPALRTPMPPASRAGLPAVAWALALVLLLAGLARTARAGPDDARCREIAAQAGRAIDEAERTQSTARA